MKRGGPLRRKTALRNTGRLNRSSELARRTVKPKPAKRDPAEARARGVVAQRSQGVCERCGRAPATNWHHRQGRSAGGKWAPENGLHLCGSGSTGCHGEVGVNPRISFEQGWMVRSGFNPADVPVWLANRGWHYLDADGGVTPTEKRAA